GVSPDPQAWLVALRDSPLVWVDEPHARRTRADENQPLVLRGSMLYLRRYWRYEQQVAARVRQRASATATVDEQQARGWLDRLFAPPDGVTRAEDAREHGEPSGPVDWQKVA